MKTAKVSVERFFAQNKFGIIGVSRNSKKFSRTIYKDLKNKGMDVVPVNPKTDSIEKDVCYKDIASLPDDVSAILLLTPKSETQTSIEQAIEKGIKHIWIQQGADIPNTGEIIAGKDLNVIDNECILMFAEPITFPHGFHRGILKIFGKLPK